MALMNMSVLLLLVWLPWLLVPQALWAAGRAGLWLAPLAVLLMAQLLPTGTALVLPWLLLGSQLVLDSDAQVLLLAAALIWLVAGYYANCWHVDRGPVGDGPGLRFRVCFLLAMGGNFGAILSADLISFYLCFSVMGLAAYGLVVRGGQSQRRRAGRIYLIMTLLGEMALFTAFVLIYQRTGALSPTTSQLAGAGNWETGLVLLAFGIKAGMAGLHFWLPLAYQAAPLPASAVLGGAMINTALVGWLNFLPLGEQSMPLWGLWLMGLGAFAALAAVLAGLLQTDAKAVLAYSSISKMGLLIALLGLALSEPPQAALLIPLMVLFALHHGLAKGALFLGIGLVKRSAGCAGFAWLAVPVLVLSAAPLTSGAQIKVRLSEMLQTVGESGAQWLPGLLAISAVLTPLLLARFLWLLRFVEPDQPRSAPHWWPWGALVSVLLGLPLIVGAPAQTLVNPTGLLIALGLSALVICWQPDWLGRWLGCIPLGDLAALNFASLLAWPARCYRQWFAGSGEVDRVPSERLERLVNPLPGKRLWERLLAAKPDFGLLWLGVIAGFLMLASGA